MKLSLERIFTCPDYTIGKLYVDGHYFCDTLEDPVRPLPPSCPDTAQGKPCTCASKVYARTAIPPGEYCVSMEHSPRFGRTLPLLHRVPHFLGILIHPGNDADDSAGCILVGRNTIKGRLVESRATSDRLNDLMLRQKAVTITIC